MGNFIKFNDVLPEDKNTWVNKSILSFDVDWASDEVLNYIIDSIERVKIPCTFFITHNSTIIQRLRGIPHLVELGVHPNFNPLINQELNAKSVKETLKYLFDIVPEAKVLRSHSMTHSARWLGLYKEFGVTHLSQYFMNLSESISPFRHINNLVEVPVYFADDGYIYSNRKNKWSKKNQDFLFKSNNFIKVYNFHPVHIALNSNSFDYYNNTRDFHKYFSEIKKIKNKENGIEKLFEKLLSS